MGRLQLNGWLKYLILVLWLWTSYNFWNLHYTKALCIIPIWPSMMLISSLSEPPVNTQGPFGSHFFLWKMLLFSLIDGFNILKMHGKMKRSYAIPSLPCIFSTFISYVDGNSGSTFPHETMKSVEWWKSVRPKKLSNVHIINWNVIGVQLVGLDIFSKISSIFLLGIVDKRKMRIK